MRMRDMDITQYVGLGDSISIDAYPNDDLGSDGLGAISLFHRNRDDVWPEFLGRDLLSLHSETRLFNLAVDGATTNYVLESQLSELPPDVEGKTLVTLTAGGNDLLQIAGVRNLQGAGTPKQIERRLRAIIQQIQTQYHDCIVLVGTIYDPTDGNGDLFVEGTTETELLAAFDETNDRIRSLVEIGGVKVADIHQHFLGHGVPFRFRDREDLYRDPNWWYRMAIEPNARGASEVRRLFWEVLGESSLSTPCDSTASSASHLAHT